jgi:hypothetical protein
MDMDFRELKEKVEKTGANPYTVLIAEKLGTLDQIRGR